MFEKEAEEYYEDVAVGTFQECTENFADAVLTAYKDGAEFGYNKANEWHFVKDKLPPMDEVVYLWHENERFPVCAYRHIPYGKTEKDWLWECYWGSGYTVTQSVAKDYWWKEIVLPELPKEIK